MCLNPVHRESVCEKLYHKTGYERKKLPEKKTKKKRERARFQLMSSSCVTSLSFSVFFLSLCLSRFNKASCRVWLSWETQSSVAGAEAEGGWNWGWLWWWWGCKLGGEHFRPFSPCNTPCSLERWQAAASSLTFVFFPSFFHFLPFHTSFLPGSPFPSHSPPSHLLFFPFLFHFLLSFFLPWKADSYFW